MENGTLVRQFLGAVSNCPMSMNPEPTVMKGSSWLLGRKARVLGGPFGWLERRGSIICPELPPRREEFCPPEGAIGNIAISSAMAGALGLHKSKILHRPLLAEDKLKLTAHMALGESSRCRSSHPLGPVFWITCCL